MTDYIRIRPEEEARSAREFSERLAAERRVWTDHPYKRPSLLRRLRRFACRSRRNRPKWTDPDGKDKTW